LQTVEEDKSCFTAVTTSGLHAAQCAYRLEKNEEKKEIKPVKSKYKQKMAIHLIKKAHKE
jgi:hypothetical protein